MVDPANYPIRDWFQRLGQALPRTMYLQFKGLARPNKDVENGVTLLPVNLFRILFF